MYKIGFDAQKYLTLQSEHIKERLASFGGKLYLEFGGKLFDDLHASRVLPGFMPDAKLQMLLKLKDQAEIVIAVNSDAIAKQKMRGDIGITYDQEVLRLIDAFQASGLYVGSVVLTQYANQNAAKAFKTKLEKLGVKVYRHYPIAGYPYDVDHIISEQGLGLNEYIETSRSLIVVTAPGPGSGKMATCLSQLYKENLMGLKSGYAKFETFPIWNLDLNHPVNIAYEAATADLADVNMIDTYHLQAYGKTTVNYNRDIEIFPVLNAIFNKIYGSSPYKSPTDMGVNMAGYCICDDEACREAAKQEIIRRYYIALVDKANGKADQSIVDKLEASMMKAGITKDDCLVAKIVEKKMSHEKEPICALELADGTVIQSHSSNLLGAPAAIILKALNMCAHQDEHTILMSPDVISPIQDLKTIKLGGNNPRLHVNEVLIALAIQANSSDVAKKAFEAMPLLKHARMHSSVILNQNDSETLKKLGINLTCSPFWANKKLYHGSK